MNYSKNFKDIVINGNFAYLGHGNPNAKILIIGKEPRIDKNDLSKQEQLERDIYNNRQQWLDNLNDDTISCDTLKDSANAHENYNPLYPYKGQKCQVRTETKEKVKGEAGTARTWVAYQRLFDCIAYGESYRKDRNAPIDFHKYVFSSDFSSEAATCSQNTDKTSTKQSITGRNEMFRHEFFQDFPIVIIAAGHYPENYKIDMEDLFKVKWIGPDSKHRFINVHYNDERTKILIHTMQLSYFSYDLLEGIARIVREFIEKDLKQDIRNFLL